jgi:ribosomal protein L14
MQATAALLGAMIQHGHTPRIIHQAEGTYIQAECTACVIVNRKVDQLAHRKVDHPR